MINIVFLVLSHNDSSLISIDKLKNLWKNNKNIEQNNDKDYNVIVYLIEYIDDLDDEYIIDDDNKTIYIKGNESLIPGCFYKTIKAIEIIKNELDPDFIIRTNLSTTFNFLKIKNIVNNMNLRDKSKIQYFLGGPLIYPDSVNDLKLLLLSLYENLSEEDMLKLKDNSLTYIKQQNKEQLLSKNKSKRGYIHGIFMLMDKSSYSLLLENYDKDEIMNKKFIKKYQDDIVISRIFNKLNCPLVNIENEIKTYTRNINIDNIDINYVKNNIFFRCKIDNTYTKTSEHIEKIINLLCENQTL